MCYKYVITLAYIIEGNDKVLRMPKTTHAKLWHDTPAHMYGGVNGSTVERL